MRSPQEQDLSLAFHRADTLFLRNLSTRRLYRRMNTILEYLPDPLNRILFQRMNRNIRAHFLRKL